ncbi:MAG: zinc ribbon domain-containing protein [Clostridia bacterium]|nr:zinc ribbon domain-containing protein [Clostridia bacterium]
MWQAIKNDPILKAVTIIILGILGFGFAFNIMFGSRGTGMEHGGGYSLDNTLSYILNIGFKLFLIALVITALIGVFKLTKKYLLDGGESKMFDSIKRDPVLKSVSIIALLVLGFGLIYFLYSRTFGLSNGYGAMMGGNVHGAMVSTGIGFGVTGLFVALLKLLVVASVVGLIIGLFMFIRQSNSGNVLNTVLPNKLSKTNAQCSNCGTKITGQYKFCPSCGAKAKEECANCSTELKKEWKCCPICGAEKPAADKSVESTNTDEVWNIETNPSEK